MLAKLTALTKTQQAAIPAHIERWARVAFSTEPADRKTAERALCEMYRYAGLSAPEILWAANPKEMACLLAGHNTGSTIQSSVRNTAEGVVWSAVQNAVESIIWNTLWNTVENLVRSTSKNTIQSAVGTLYDGGQTWVAWPAVESFYREVCGLELPGNLSARGKALADYRASVGPGLWFKKVAVLCERPLLWEPLTWRESTNQAAKEK
jgi:hypothetical protein